MRREGEIKTAIPNRLAIVVDILAYAVSFLSLAFTFDQVRIIWLGNNVSGISLLSWIFYTLSACVWFFYGCIHKDKVITVTNFVWVVFSVLIVVGIFLHR